MVKIKKWLVFIFATIILVSSVFILNVVNKSNFANADYDGSAEINNAEIINNGSEDEMEPYATVSLSISLNGGDGKVWATVRNDFSLFFPTVGVIVELYSSSTYCESYTDMELVSINSITDLNIYKTIVASASTDGVQKYWQGRMRYKINGGDWKEKSTGTGLYDGNGNFLGYT